MSRNSFFEFKQFRINQENCAMKVGTDGVLLGAWTPIPPTATHILDIGTGSGLLALMVAQRTHSHAHIDAVEIDPTAAQQAKENFMMSPWTQQLHVIHSDFQSFEKNTLQKYDVILSNPPYFRNSLQTPNTERTMARHSSTLSLDEWVIGLPVYVPTTIEGLKDALKKGPIWFCDKVHSMVIYRVDDQGIHIFDTYPLQGDGKRHWSLADVEKIEAAYLVPFTPKDVAPKPMVKLPANSLVVVVDGHGERLMNVDGTKLYQDDAGKILLALS